MGLQKAGRRVGRPGLWTQGASACGRVAQAAPQTLLNIAAGAPPLKAGQTPGTAGGGGGTPPAAAATPEQPLVQQTGSVGMDMEVAPAAAAAAADLAATDAAERDFPTQTPRAAARPEPDVSAEEVVGTRCGDVLLPHTILKVGGSGARPAGCCITGGFGDSPTCLPARRPASCCRLATQHPSALLCAAAALLALQSDHFPGCQNMKLTPLIEGAPNFRQVPDQACRWRCTAALTCPAARGLVRAAHCLLIAAATPW